MEELNFGKLIKNKRLEVGLSLIELGAKLGCSASYLSGLENGKESPSESMLKKLSKHLDVPQSELLKRAAMITDLDIQKLPVDEAAGIIAFYKTCIQKGISTRAGAEAVEKLGSK